MVRCKSTKNSLSKIVRHSWKLSSLITNIRRPLRLRERTIMPDYELPKVRRLAPERYVLATSLGLTPANVKIAERGAESASPAASVGRVRSERAARSVVPRRWQRLRLRRRGCRPQPSQGGQWRAWQRLRRQVDHLLDGRRGRRGRRRGSGCRQQARSGQ